MEDINKLHTVKEILSIGSRDSERFVEICSYYLEYDYKRFELIIKPMLAEILNYLEYNK